MTTATALPLPKHFNPAKAKDVYRVNYASLAQEAQDWAKQHNITNPALDKTKICLMGIDIQNTFCLPDYELPVQGAVEDTVRTAEFIYRNIDILSEIAPTMDTHVAIQIFHPVMWVDRDDNHPTPGTIISFDAIESGDWKINPAVAYSLHSNYNALQKYVKHYAKILSNGGKYPLIIWPYHAMLGGIGHALVSIFHEACFFHSIARNIETNYEIKGGKALTENYSVLRPEVLTDHNNNVIAEPNSRFISKLLNYDYVIIAGQAKSHCVAWTIQDLLDEILKQDPVLAKKVYLLEDCTSPVIIPGVFDFTDQANEAFEKFANAGMNIVKSTDPIDSWPGVVLN